MGASSPRRYHGQWVCFLTCVTQGRYPYFQEKILCEIRIEELKICKEIKQFLLYAFCLNYNHFHLLMRPDEKVANISQIMQAFKKNVSQDINKIMGFYPAGANSNSRLQQVNIDAYREEYIRSWSNLPKFQRQRSFHDHVIRNKEDFKEYYQYARHNYLHHDEMPTHRSYHSWNEKYEDMLDVMEV